ncbi:MAG: bifunctional oligoribonuclease/PAP phosphatase NrnA [Flavobacteriales bacterium]|nr:bifunctional oligoribonuclease/PAP phosphatase NrnA [Flavobacteriales bacterium]
MSAHYASPERVAPLRELLAVPRRIAITTHYNPDGDAMGSSLGLAGVLKAMGHTVHVVPPNTPPPNLHWLPGHADILPHDKMPAQALQAMADAEIVFALDFNRTDRVHELEAALKAAPLKVLIDHHRDPEDFAQLTFSDHDVCSTCEMVYDIVEALGAASSIDRDAATCLLTGIITDTGSFRYPSTTPHTLRVAAALMEHGISTETIHHAVMDDNSEERMRLLGFTLHERLTVLPELGTAIIRLSVDDLQRFNYKPGDTEGFVNQGLAIQGVRLAAFFLERPNEVKLSLRSKGALPVDQLARAHFAGGGHRNASGGRGTDGLDNMVKRFMQVLPDFIAQHPA